MRAEKAWQNYASKTKDLHFMRRQPEESLQNLRLSANRCLPLHGRHGSKEKVNEDLCIVTMPIMKEEEIETCRNRTLCDVASL